MNRKYPFKLFLLMVLLKFVIHHFYLFLPGLILSILGIWSKTCLTVGLALLLLDLVMSVVDQIFIRKASLEESDNPEFNEFMDAAFGTDGQNSLHDVLAEKMAEEDKKREESQAALQWLVVYRTLKESIHDGMALDEMIDAFQQMCKISVGDPDDLLFETGTFSFDSNKLFHFGLVRQFKFLDDDEYVQLHLDVLYTPSLKTKFLYTIKWGNLSNGNFFDTVRGSLAYRIVKSMPIHSVKVHVDET